ncbi:MAG: hypothetical protein AB8B96_20285 [Lysobacterales bacterium]
MKRRSIFKAAGAAAIAGSAGMVTTTRVNAARPLNPEVPEDLHIIHRKLNFSMDDRPVFWFIDAVRMGLKDYEFTPFWRMHVGMISRVRDIADYQYESTLLMKIFYSDLTTGKLLQTWDNPYTGQTRTVQQPKLATFTRTHGLTGVIRPTQDNSKVREHSRRDVIGPASVVNDDVWCNGDLVEKIGKPNRIDSVIHVNDWSTFHGSISEVSDPNVASAAATHTFNDINTFNHPWIGMRGVTANSVSRGHGRKSYSIDGMPAPWRRFMAQHHPDVLADIPAALAG